MAKPDGDLVVKWRKLAEDGFLYAEIARMYPQYSVDQVRHYCLGHTGRGVTGPLQTVDRWYGSNVWLRGENSPHAQLTAAQANVLFENTSLNPHTGQPAIDYARTALGAGVHVVTANKGPVVHAYHELRDLAAANGVRFLHEAAVMGGLERDLGKRFKTVDEFARVFCTAVRDGAGKRSGFLASLFRKSGE